MLSKNSLRMHISPRIYRFGIVVLAAAALFAFLVHCLIVPPPIVLGAGSAKDANSAPRQDWPIYGGDPNGDRYSPLRQINRQNVKQLRVAWRSRCRNRRRLADESAHRRAHDVCSYSSEQVLALDAATGAKLWTFDAGVPGDAAQFRGFSCGPMASKASSLPRR